MGTEFNSSLAGLSTEGDNLANLCQEPAAEADGNSRCICVKWSMLYPPGACWGDVQAGGVVNHCRGLPLDLFERPCLGEGHPRVWKRPQLGPGFLYQGGLEEPPLLVLS